jgi:hypothetical protein
MPAQFRIDQATPGLGVSGRARHDLVVGETITLTATTPAPGPGVNYTWEILDKVGTTAVLTATSGQAVTIPGASLVSRPYAFKVRLTVNDNGSISRTTRVFGARSANRSLRVPLFGEDAPRESSLASNDPELSIDNAVYADRAGTGVTEQNWRGWAEWAWELVNAVDLGSPPSVADHGDLTGLGDDDHRQYLLRVDLRTAVRAIVVAEDGGVVTAQGEVTWSNDFEELTEGP